MPRPLIDFAKRCWKDSPGTYRNFSDIHVLRGEKTVAVGLMTGGFLDIVVFPQPRHLKAFKKAAAPKQILDNGPAALNPGGILTMSFDVTRPAPRITEFGFIKSQSQYKLGKREGNLDYALHEEYDPVCRKNAFDLLLRIVGLNGSQVVFPRTPGIGVRYQYTPKVSNVHAGESLNLKIRSAIKWAHDVNGTRTRKKIAETRGQLAAFEKNREQTSLFEKQLMQACLDAGAQAVYEIENPSEKGRLVDKAGKLVIRPPAGKPAT